jgi:predicted permease
VQNVVRATRVQHYEFDPDEKVSTGTLIPGRGATAPAMELKVLVRVAAVAVIVLAIAIANVVNLLLLRTATRQREVAVRRALGVSTRRLIWQLTVEATLLSLLAGAVAIVVGEWSGRLIRQLVMPTTHWSSSPIDGVTALFVLCLSLLIGVFAGLAPAIQGLRTPVSAALSAGRVAGATHRSRVRSFLVALQASLCVVLLVGASLFVKSLANVELIDTGYNTHDVVVAYPIFPPKTGIHREELARAIPEMARTLARNPAIETVSYARSGPMSGASFGALFLPGGDTLPRRGGEMGPSTNVVSPTFFAASGMRVLRGRAFSDGDGPTAPRVAIVNATMAALVWTGVDPVGKCLIIGERTAPCSTIVGVVNDATGMRLLERKTSWYFTPASQSSVTDLPASTLVVRARAGQTARVSTIVTKTMREALPNVDGVSTRTVYSFIEREARPWNIGATLFTAFGILAFIVAGVGVYSVVAYGVAQRTHELGIRIALGATRAQITDLVIASGLRSVGVGIVIGLAASWMLAPLVRSLLFGVTTNDASTYIGAATALCILGTLASLVPAMRAARVDPVVALRSE